MGYADSNKSRRDLLIDDVEDSSSESVPNGGGTKRKTIPSEYYANLGKMAALKDDETGEMVEMFCPFPTRTALQFDGKRLSKRELRGNPNSLYNRSIVRGDKMYEKLLENAATLAPGESVTVMLPVTITRARGDQSSAYEADAGEEVEDFFTKAPAAK